MPPPSDLTPPPVIEVMGLGLHMVTREEIVDRVVEAVRAGRAMRVINANAHCVTLAQRRPWLRRMFHDAEIRFCDGAGVQLASLFLSGRKPPRTTPPEWVGPALERLGGDASVYWLGGTEEAAEIAAQIYSARYGCKTAGAHGGFFDPTPGSPDSEKVLQEIQQARPSVLLLNMGMPRQERWLCDNWSRLPPTVAITAGALVDHAAGRVSRPPRWVADMGLEWLVRLVREPRRLWRRYLLGLPVFGLYVLRWKLFGRRSARAAEAL
ncbi:glycosyl transferase [Acetobacter sp. DsW_063]|nr:glycosyl transferase [Acetobacter sp. DsW_063]